MMREQTPSFGDERQATTRACPHILIVDDDAIQQVVAREYLEIEGYEVSASISGDDCLEHARIELPDLIILDVMMPGIDGFEACRRIRADPALTHIPVLMVTGLDDPDSIGQAFEAGATDFLCKPVIWPLLVYRVKFMLRLNAVERSLRTTMHLAEAANRAKSNFLATMSHELRTPLNAIIGFSELMRAGWNAPSGQGRYLEYLSDIHGSGVHLLEIVNNVLDVSKIDIGKIEIYEEIVEVEPLARAAIEQVMPHAVAQDITIELAIPARLPMVRADKSRLKQIMTNLLSNAVKFTPESGEIHFNIDRAPSGDMIFVIRDTGIGMAIEDLPKIERPFHQIDERLNRRFSGTGLGIPIASAMVKLHDGSLHFESEIDVGTTVTFTLPASRLIAAAGTGADASHAAQEPANQPGSKDTGIAI